MTGLTRTPLVFLALMAGVTPLSALSYVPTATVLTLEGATLSEGAPTTSWNEIMTGPICQQATTCAPIPYPSYEGVTGILQGVPAVTEALSQTEGEVVVFGYSNGAMVGSLWLAANRFNPDAPDPENVSFLLVGNVFREHGGALGFLSALLPETQYQVTDVTRQYDWLSDAPTNPLNLVALANAALGYAFVHIDYHDVDLVDPANTPGAVSWTEGNTTYVFVPTENLPLLEPLRMLGMNDLADQLNAPLKVIVEAGYDRNLPETDGDPTGTAGHSLDYIPTNAVNVLNRAPANEIHALVQLASAVTDSDATDAAKLAALVNVLVPYPALSEPLGEQLNSFPSTGQLDLLTPAISVFDNLTAPPSTMATESETLSDARVADRDAQRDGDAADDDAADGNEPLGEQPSDADGAEAGDQQQGPAQTPADDDESDSGRHRAGVPVRDLIHRVTGVSAGQDQDDDQSPRRGLFGAPTAVRDQIRSAVSGGAADNASDGNDADHRDADHRDSDHGDSGNDSAGADE